MVIYILITYETPVSNIWSKLPSVFFLQRTGIGSTDFLGVEWYISSMLLALFVIYPLMKWNYDITVRIAAPVGSVLMIGYLIQTYHKLSESDKYEE